MIDRLSAADHYRQCTAARHAARAARDGEGANTRRRLRANGYFDTESPPTSGKVDAAEASNDAPGLITRGSKRCTTLRSTGEQRSSLAVCAHQAQNTTDSPSSQPESRLARSPP